MNTPSGSFDKGAVTLFRSVCGSRNADKPDKKCQTQHHNAVKSSVFDQHNEACTLILRGALSEDQVLRFFDLLVPAKIRGAKKNEPFWCVNVCEHAMIYRNVTLLTGVTAKQTSDPAAIITFSRPECKVAVVEANKMVLDIRSSVSVAPGVVIT